MMKRDCSELRGVLKRFTQKKSGTNKRYSAYKPRLRPTTGGKEHAQGYGTADSTCPGRTAVAAAFAEWS